MAHTPQLDAFFDSRSSRPLVGQQQVDFVAAIFAAARGAERPGFRDDYLPHRIMVMWRLVRITALIKGLCSEDETLDEATDQTPSPWGHPFLPVLGPSDQAALRRERASLLLQLHAADKGLPLLPPRHDADQLDRWCSAAGIVAKDLGIERSDYGVCGLQGLLDPAVCAKCDVTVGQVIAFEDMIIAECQDLFLDRGERQTMKHFRDSYGMGQRECQQLLRLVKSQALRQTQASIEEKRALQERRIENYLSRCKEAMDMDGEMKALKELAKIQGLTRTDPEDTGREFYQVVQRVAQRQDLELTDAGPRRARLLDTGRSEAVQPITIEATVRRAADDDDEAEAEFDRENR